MSHIESPKSVQRWLLLCVAAAFVMIFIGGITRLTGSGLSMVEWKPLTGWLPPLNPQQWAAEFARYQQSPEFQLVHPQMDVAGFKGIFWLEYIHRVFGRMIGIVFFLPLLWFAFTRSITAKHAAALLGLFGLGGLQAVLGWLMVKSGLVQDPHVSPVMLSVHLTIGTLIFAGLTVAYLHARGAALSQFCNARIWLALLLFLQIAYGAFVAGNHAGLRYNDWPLMEGKLLPEGMWLLAPWWQNITENIGTIQFIHRLLAYLIVGLLLWQWWRWRFASVAIHAVAALVLVQLGLGIATLMLHVPIILASAHQMVAFLLLFAVFCFVQEPRKDHG